MKKRNNWYAMIFCLLGASCGGTGTFEVTGTIPTQGPTIGYIPVKIIGNGFVPGATATFGRVTALNTTWVSETELEVVLPPNPGKVGPVGITVTNPVAQGGQTDTKAGLFTYVLSSISYGIPTKIDVGKEPVAMAVADLDADGYPDVITGNATDNNLSVLINQGGTLQPAVAVEISGKPSMSAVRAVAAGDVDGDGKTDVVVGHSSNNSSQVSVLGGMGGTAFKSPVTLTVGKDPRFVLLADLNNDGKTDIVTTNTQDNTVSVALNTSTSGNISFGAAKTVLVGTAPTFAATGDLNNDGKLDVLVVNSMSSQVTLLMGKGDGTFQLPASIALKSGYRASSIAIGDLNKDQKLDFVVTIPNQDSVGIYYNGGNQGTTVQFPTFNYVSTNTNSFNPAVPRVVTTEDINGDGRLDLLVANRGQGQIWMGLSQPDNSLQFVDTFGTHNVTSPEFVIGKDMNRDGRLDIVAIDASRNTVQWMVSDSQ